MKTRIEFIGYVDVYEESVDNPDGWVEFALERGDKHASNHSAWLEAVVSVNKVGDDE